MGRDAGVLAAGHFELATVALLMLETIRRCAIHRCTSLLEGNTDREGIEADELKQPGTPGTLLRTPRQQCKQEGRANGQAFAATDNLQPDAKRSGTPDLLHEGFMTDSKPMASHLLVLPVPLVAQKPSSSGAYSFYPSPQSPPPFLESPLSSSSVHLRGCWLCNHRARHLSSDLP